MTVYTEFEEQRRFYIVLCPSCVLTSKNKIQVLTPGLLDPEHNNNSFFLIQISPT